MPSVKGALIPPSLREKVLPILGAVSLLGVIGATIYVQSQVKNVVEWVSNSGPAGATVMTGIVFAIGLPWSMGYSIVAVVIGFLYGFWGLPILFVGNLLSCVNNIHWLTSRFSFCLVLVRRWGKEWFLAKIQNTKHLQTTLRAVNHDPITFSLLLRVTPLANGWISTIMAISSIPTFGYFWTAVIGHIPKDLMYILFGHYTVESLSSAFQGGTWSETKIILLVVQVVVFLTATTLLAVIGKRTLKKLETMDAEEGGLSLEEVTIQETS